MSCKICQSPTEKLFEKRLLGKYEVDYFRCARCGFIQTEDPYWLEESYESAVADLDLGPVNRAVLGSQAVENLILAGFDANSKYVDWGGGYGIFTRLMRDRGFDFYWKDIYCPNLFAKEFVASEGERYELLTAFEVFEHLPDPLGEIETMLAYSRNIFFTTLLVPPDLTDQWWYLLPETGQHIAFYTPEALAVVADRFGLKLTSDGIGNHLLSEKGMSQRLFRRMIANGRIAGLMRRYLRRRLGIGSLLEQDFEKVSGLKL